jgi:gliding motility-associated-like protein/uncharacterized delta-60 repeat protein
MNSFLDVVRYEEDGTIDGTFDAGMTTEQIFAIGLQPDGKVLVSFTQEATPPLLARLEANGDMDGTFNAPNNLPTRVFAVQSDGYILLGGWLDGGITRLDPNGNLDPAFDASVEGEVYDIEVLSDGKIIVVGAFSYVNNIPMRGMVRLNPDGSVDSSFSIVGISDPLESGSYFTQVAMLSDGDYILAGRFDGVSGIAKKNLVKLNNDGSVDCDFHPGNSTDEIINQMAIQTDGKILIGGNYSNYDGTTRFGFARVNNSSLNITILAQPQDTFECLGSSETITTVATGTTNIQYQWQFSSSVGGPFLDIPNSGGYSFVTSSTVIINTTGNFGEGYYRCRINGDLAAEVFTSIVFFDVIVVPAPSANDVTVCAGDPIVLTATGGTDGNYRWVDSDNSLVTGAVNGTFIDDGNNFGPPFQVYLVEGSCEGPRVTVNVIVNSCTESPVIATAEITVAVQGSTTLDLLPLLSDPDNDLDLNSLTIVQQPNSGAVASINITTLSIDYTGISFSGTDNLRISICDLSGNCTEQELSIEVVGHITVYNALSPGDDGKNDVFYLQYIDILESTQKNKVTIFNRWGDVVWETENYNNTTRVFKGLNKNGNELPTGVYFYRITFSSAEKPVEGFISLKR